MFKWHVLLLSVFLVSSLGSHKSSLADGCYIPDKAVKKMPEIPGQRAIIAWKDGTETLIISSALDSEAQELGWIIPVPNIPVEMKKVSPGALKTLNFCLQPEITHDLSQEVRAVAFVTILGVLLLGIIQFKREWLASFLLLLLILMCGSALLLPALGGGARATANASSVHVDKTARVGAYDIVVLRAEKAEDLDAWLSQHGFATLPQNALPIIAGYAKDKWVFVAIKLTREEGGRSAPHPIKLVFESKEAVYPLKLTSLPGGDTFFELFLIAANRVSSTLLETEFCDTFHQSRWGRDEDAYEYGFEHCYTGADTRQKVGHPEICKLMWPGCILTKISGEIAGEEMTDDLRFIPREYAPYRQRFFSQTGAQSVAIMVVIALLGVFCIVTFITFRKQLRESGGTRRYLRKAVLPTTALIFLLSIIVFIYLPKIGTDQTHVTRWRVRPSFANELYYVIATNLKKKDQGLLQKKETEIAQHILADLEAWNESYPDFGTSNRVSGGQIKIEDTPGNFTVEKNDDRLTIRIYDYLGSPMILKYPPEPTAEE